MEKVIYSKCSTERKKKYKIVTSIIEKDGKRVVRKTAANPMAKEHVNAMFDYYNKVKQDHNDIINVPCKLISDGCLEFEYINGTNYAEKIQKCAEQNDLPGLIKCVSDIRNIIVNVSNKQPFSSTKEFEAIFGEQEWLTGMESAKNINIDVLAENVILKENNKYIIDYELTFPFSVPLKYVVFRMLFFNTTISTLPENIKNDIYKECEISAEEWEKFYRMELIFQSYLSENSLNEVKDKIGMKSFLLSQNNVLISELCYTVESEKGNVLARGYQYGNELKIEIDVKKAKHVTLKVDYESCSIKILKNNAELIDSNEALLIGKDMFFENMPVLKFDVENINDFQLDVQILNENNALINPLLVYNGKCKELEAQLLNSGDEVSRLVKEVDRLTNDILQLGEERNNYIAQIGMLNANNEEWQEKYKRQSQRDEKLISELGYELSKIKSAKDFDKFAKKNKLYEG